MPKAKKLERLSINHDKNKQNVYVFWIDGVTSGTISLTPEEAIAIGEVGQMAKVYREETKGA